MNGLRNSTWNPSWRGRIQAESSQLPYICCGFQLEPEIHSHRGWDRRLSGLRRLLFSYVGLSPAHFQAKTCFNLFVLFVQQTHHPHRYRCTGSTRSSWMQSSTHSNRTPLSSLPSPHFFSVNTTSNPSLTTKIPTHRAIRSHSSLRSDSIVARTLRRSRRALNGSGL